MVVESQEELFVLHHLLLPLRPVYRLQLVEGRARKIEPLPVDVVKVRSPPDRRLLAHGAAADTVDDPLENTHVFAVSRPQEAAIGTLAEPVDMEDPRRRREVTLHAQPVPEVITHVVAAEGQHSHRVAPYLADGACGRCGSLRAHRSADVDSRGPVE